MSISSCSLRKSHCSLQARGSKAGGCMLSLDHPIFFRTMVRHPALMTITARVVAGTGIPIKLSFGMHAHIRSRQLAQNIDCCCSTSHSCVCMLSCALVHFSLFALRIIIVRTRQSLLWQNDERGWNFFSLQTLVGSSGTGFALRVSRFAFRVVIYMLLAGLPGVPGTARHASVGWALRFASPPSLLTAGNYTWRTWDRPRSNIFHFFRSNLAKQIWSHLKLLSYFTSRGPCLIGTLCLFFSTSRRAKKKGTLPHSKISRGTKYYSAFCDTAKIWNQGYMKIYYTEVELFSRLIR